MNQIKEAVFASQHAASCMANRDYTGTIAAFRQALQSLQSMVLHTEVGALTLESWRLTTMPLGSSPIETRASDSCCDLFGHCFLITPMPCHECVPTSNKLALFVAALFFNTALAYHLRASFQVVSQPGQLDRAMSLYEKAGKILRGLGDTSDGAALMLAVSNNMASLAWERFDMKAFMSHRHDLASYLSLSASSKNSHAKFFAMNFASIAAVHRRGAAAA